MGVSAVKICVFAGGHHPPIGSGGEKLNVGDRQHPPRLEKMGGTGIPGGLLLPPERFRFSPPLRVEKRTFLFRQITVLPGTPSDSRDVLSGRAGKLEQYSCPAPQELYALERARIIAKRQRDTGEICCSTPPDQRGTAKYGNCTFRKGFAGNRLWAAAEEDLLLRGRVENRSVRRRPAIWAGPIAALLNK